MNRSVSVKYGSQDITLELDEARLAYNLKPAERAPLDDFAGEVDRALAAPLDSAKLTEMVKPGDEVVIVADDDTRPTPVDILVPKILDQLNAGGVPDSDIYLVIALGTHRPMTGNEIERKYGPAVTGRIRICNHDCLDSTNLSHCSITRRGTDIWVNSRVLAADLCIGVGSVVPHHPIGWSGGAKILLPGVAGQHTIGQMHLLGASEQLLGEIETPCREEMEDFASALKAFFIVNVVMKNECEVAGIAAGNFISAHRECVKLGRKIFGAPFRRKSDITLSSAYPVDYDFFQADKGIFSAAVSTKKGGEIILISPCHEGMSPTHREALELSGVSDDILLEMARDKNNEYDPLSIAEILYLNSARRIFNVTVVSEGIPRKVASKIGFNHVEPSLLGKYIQQRLKEDASLSLGIINSSAKTLPVYEP